MRIWLELVCRDGVATGSEFLRRDRPFKIRYLSRAAATLVWWNKGDEIRVPEARNNLAQHGAEGGVLGQWEV